MYVLCLFFGKTVTKKFQRAAPVMDEAKSIHLLCRRVQADAFSLQHPSYTTVIFATVVLQDGHMDRSNISHDCLHSVKIQPGVV